MLKPLVERGLERLLSYRKGLQTLQLKEGEKAGLNRVKFEIEYHTITIQSKFVFVCMTFFEGLFSFPVYLIQI